MSIKSIKLLHKFLKKVIIILLRPHQVIQIFKHQLYLMSAIKLPIIDSSNLGKIVKTIKEETIEKVFFPKVFGLALGSN